MLKQLKKLLANSNAAIKNLFEHKKTKYLIAGAVNTAFGYFVTLLIYYGLQSFLNLIAIMVLANVVCITFSFVIYKLFVFKTKANWLKEYLRCYLVYGGAAIVGIFGIWILVELLGIPFWIAQALLLSISIVVSYLGHDRFTFRAKKEIV